MIERQWHVGRRPVLGWAETGVKLVGVAVGVYALWQGTTALAAWSTGSTIAVILLGCLAGSLTPAVRDHWRRREVVSMVLIVLNIVGHWCAVAHLLSAHGITPPISVFAAFMLVGEGLTITRIRKGVAPDGVSTRALIGQSALYAAGYAAIFGLSAAFGT